MFFLYAKVTISSFTSFTILTSNSCYLLSLVRDFRCPYSNHFGEEIVPVIFLAVSEGIPIC